VLLVEHIELVLLPDGWHMIQSAKSFVPTKLLSNLMCPRESWCPEEQAILTGLMTRAWRTMAAGQEFSLTEFEPGRPHRTLRLRRHQQTIETCLWLSACCDQNAKWS
jgi:hypothetical protein